MAAASHRHNRLMPITSGLTAPLTEFDHAHSDFNSFIHQQLTADPPIIPVASPLHSTQEPPTMSINQPLITDRARTSSLPQPEIGFEE
jgi:hypothetical protein